MVAEILPESKLVVPLDELVAIATEIVRENVRLHGDAKAAIEPYTPTVKKLVAANLTYSEKKAAGLLSQDELDAIEYVLRASAVQRERSHERRSAQTSRAGWRPRKTSKKRLAEDIAASMMANPGRTLTDYGCDAEVAGMVNEILA